MIRFRFSSPHIAAAPVFLAAMLLPLSFTGGVVTTPAIGHELGGSPASLAWLTNGFMLTFGSFLLAAGVAADLTGRKRVLIGGLALFTLSCLLIYPAGSTPMAGALRAVQGMAAAMTLAGGSAALARLYDGPARAQAFSLLGTLFGAGLAFGPLVTGTITDLSGWRGVYLMLALLSGIALLTGALFLPGSAKPPRQKTDIAGIVLFSTALILFTLGIMLIPDQGLFSPGVIGVFTAFMLFTAGFVIRCQRAEHPVFELSLLRHPRFAGVLLLPVATCYCYVVLLIILPLRFMGGEAFSETKSALFLLALTGPMLVLPSLAAFLTRWHTPGVISVIGLGVSTAGLLLLSQVMQSDNSAMLILAMFITGAGAALPWGLMDGLAVSAVPVEKAGMAAGLFNTVRVAGEGIALAVVMAFLAMVNQRELMGDVTGYPPGAIKHAATWLGGGNVEQAARLLPAVPRQVLMATYNHAYSLLFYGLSVITLLSAWGVWKTLIQQKEQPVM
ncbi:MFS transporter [Chimaeribacter arupi]|uniref:MFS transporter n=1 Tax=Chimaeribacter arupi TaxID=2060066 RepID=UPI000C795ED9|nr:MFS transporter [Chimaeribacter arupi]PLR47511.1 MFS transporter [Chimaeribacter arupi]